MAEYSTLSSKGQLVIPKKIREQAGWLPGDQLEMEWTGDGLQVRKKIRMDNSPQVSLVRELLGKYRTAGESGASEEDQPRKLRDSLYGKLDS